MELVHKPTDNLVDDQYIESKWIIELVLFRPTPRCILTAPWHGWNQYGLLTLCSLLRNRKTI